MRADDGTTEGLAIVEALNAVQHVVRPAPVSFTREEALRWIREMQIQKVRGAQFVRWDASLQLFRFLK